MTPDGARWHCFACGADGDAAELVRAVKGEAAGAWCIEFLESRSATPQSPAPARARARAYPPRDELLSFVAAGGRVDDDPGVAGFLERRRIEPGTVAALDLARALPCDAICPPWARHNPDGVYATWADSGHRLIVRLHNAAGEMRSVIGRRVDRGTNDDRKSAAVTGYARGGLVMADPLARTVLEEQEWPGSARCLVVGEGEPDFLAWSISPSAEAERHATMGVFEGAWGIEFAARIPDDTTIIIATHADPKGDKYARKIISSFAGRRVVLKRWWPNPPLNDACEMLAAGHELVPDGELIEVSPALAPTATLEPTPTSTRALTRPDLAAICRKLPGKYLRIPTHCAPLDKLTGGGLTTGRLAVIGGPPGVIKTGWVLAMSWDMAGAGTVVHFVAADEPRDGLLSRIGQIEGESRASLDDEDLRVSGPAWDRTATRVEARPGLVIWSPTDDGATVERIAEAAREHAAELGARLVLVIDSIQVAPFDCDTVGRRGVEPSLRERMDARMATLKRLRNGACVIAISELNRAAYRQDAKADLGGFKESSSLEYGADVALTLQRVKGEDGVIEVTPQKNRLGGLDAFRTRRTLRCTFESVAMPTDVERERGALDAATVAVAVVKKQIVEKLRAACLAGRHVTTVEQLCALVTARKTTALKAIAVLKNEARLVGGGGKEPYRIDESVGGRSAEESGAYHG